MAPSLTFFAENADSISTAHASFSMSGGSHATQTLYLSGDNYEDGAVPLEDVIESISIILGEVNTLPTYGIIDRSLPLAHPLYPWLYASSVGIRGYGQPYKAISQIPMEAPPLPNMTAYRSYEFNVDFTPRPYVVASNASVPLLPVVFYDASGLPIPVEVGAEWVRFTNWWYDRKFESITARQGQMRFRLANGGTVANVPFVDMPKLFLPDSVLHILWHQVPYRYIYSENSYLDGLIGYINQNKFTTWEPGELLYIGYNAKPYTPPVQELDAINTGTTGFIFSAEKLVDVELLFLRTKRKLGSAGELYNSPTIGTVGLPYWIQAGWNLAPNVADRLFHYVTTVDTSTKLDTDSTRWKPLFNSAEFSLLFSDPDATLYALDLPV